jgi:hypothetical protein
MKKSISPALLGFMSLVVVATAGILSAAKPFAPTANAAAPVVSPSAGSGWSDPIDVSNDPRYDNSTGIGASPINGAVTIGWERRNVNPTDENWIIQASNLLMGGNFTSQELSSTGYKQNGNVRVRHDSLGNRHMVWWQQDGATVCDYYAVIGPTGQRLFQETVENENLGWTTCGTGRKNTALAVGPDNTIHALFGANLNNIYYYHREADGDWTEERIPQTGTPVDIAIGVTTNNVIIVAWKDGSPGGNSDIYTATRNSPNNWTVEDVSYDCCAGCPGNSHAYLPSLYPDPSGGMRLSWSDEMCDPRYDPPINEIYYREWKPGTGWNNQPLVRVTHNSGHSYLSAIAVDNSGKATIVWQDTTGMANGDFQIFFSQGSGTVFTGPTNPFGDWGGLSGEKEPSADFAFGNVHISFSSKRDDPQYKDNYYSYLASGGPAPTPTPSSRCPGQRFTDVCPDDYFYQPVLGLNDIGAIQGYNTNPPCDTGTPCFKPYNNVTRAQSSKIIGIAAGFDENIPPSQQTFADVPSTHTFWVYIERMASRGIISGYTCGGLLEPCDAQHRPYFRPNNNVTRGQLSKMTALAFNFNEPVQGQTFTDVTPTNAFYPFVERLAGRNILNGYNCGGPGEPCDGQNRPYFRPNNNITRGQTAKVVYGAYTQSTPTPSPTATSTEALPTDTPTATELVPTVTVTLDIPTVTVTEVLPTVTVTLPVPTLTITPPLPTATDTPTATSTAGVLRMGR